MTPVPLDLPLRPSEAAELASLIFESAERKPLTDEIRNRIAARTSALRFESITPQFGSLARDPVHPSTYYMAVDVENGPPYLLHMAPATAPTSSIFQKPLLVGRMRETVINAVPFGPGDTDALEKFANQIDKAFLPRPHGAQTTIVAGPGVPDAFDAFRAIWKRTGRNVASIGGSYYAGLWAAIRGGWRHGYSAVVRIPSTGGFDAIKDAIRDSALYSTFVFAAGAPGEEALLLCEWVHNQIRQTRSALKINRPFDFELALDGFPQATTPQDLAFCLEWLKARDHAAQLVAPNLEGCDEAQIRELAAVCLQFQCSMDVAPGHLDAVARATGGRVTCSLWSGQIDRDAIERIAESFH